MVQARSPVSEIDLLWNAPLGFASFSSELRCVQVNREFLRMTGLTSAEHLGRTLTEAVPALAPVVDALERVRQSGGCEDVEVTAALAGRQRPTRQQWSLFPVRASASPARPWGLWSRT